MKLILTDDVAGLGGKGEVVEVADGYGRNYLLPRKLAMKATAGALRDADAIRQSHEEALRKVFEGAASVAKSLVGTRVVIAAQAGDEGRLFGSVTAADVVDGVLKFTGVQLERSTVQMSSPIKSIGLHEVQIKLHPEVQFPLTIDVIPA
ncbi:MAG: 50S ribosomal protein L9 [Acidimicrobiia bacterium]|jgi:large subunit ribosomal protein L9|nr:50S ribosomal protein L9 [Acidimicrobiia bacterium]